MKKAMIAYIKGEKGDEFYTPEYAVEPLIEFINHELTVWEPTDFGESKITSCLNKNGNKVISSHISTGQNFFEYSPDFHYDMIITNPPYSLKTEFIKRCFELEKPFALLLPITALEGQERGKIYREFGGIELLVLDRRVEFISGKTNWFNTSWFCKDVLPEKLMFKEITKTKI